MSSCSSDGQTTNCPKLAPAILFTILYTLTTTLHFYQAWHYRKPFLWVLIMGGIWEIIGMTTRIGNIQHYNQTVDNTSFMFILLAPLWINAFVYVTLGRLVHMYMPDKQLGGVKARRLGTWFVLLDISSFLIQLGGGIMVVGGDDDPEQVRNGTHIYTAGTSIQEAVILVFVGLSIVFSRRLKKENIERDIAPAKKLMTILYIALGLIAFRVAFRIIEFSTPFDSTIYWTINDNEYFVFIFDSTPMFLALLAFNIYHPGKTVQGPDSEYPKLTKEEKREMKQRKQEDKRVTKERKKEEKGFRRSSVVEIV